MTRTVNPALPAVVLLLSLAAAPGRGPADKLAPCRVPGVEEEVLCGRYEVDEDRARAARR
ncbi:MAG TPA: hypothetical protein VNJ70_18550 [Thermoanaerobaculia bacterium]|nr:hypothetical protein [Thermoanaerobaculia bacterium]